MNPKHCIAYKLEGQIESGELSDKLIEHRIHPLREDLASTMTASGWTTPLECCDDFVIKSGDAMLITLREEWRDIPAAVIREELALKVSEIEKNMGRRVYRKEKLQLKDEIVLDLAPKAFIRSKVTQAIIVPGWIFVLASSHNQAEVLLCELRTTLGSLKVSMPNVAQPLDSVLGSWLDGGVMPPRWVLGDECKLVDPMGDKTSVQSKGEFLPSETISAYMMHGYVCARLATIYVDSLKMVVHSDMTLHGIGLTEEYTQEYCGEIPDDEVAALKSDIWLWGGLLSRAIIALIESCGGEVEA